MFDVLLLSPGKGRGKEFAMTNCKGLDGIPVAPLSPLEVTHEKWGKASDVFVAFGHLKTEGRNDGPAR